MSASTTPWLPTPRARGSVESGVAQRTSPSVVGVWLGVLGRRCRDVSADTRVGDIIHHRRVEVGVVAATLAYCRLPLVVCASSCAHDSAGRQIGYRSTRRERKRFVNHKLFAARATV